MNKTLSYLVKLYHRILQPLLVLFILLVGYFSAEGLTLFKQEPPKNKIASYAPLVKTLKSQIENRTLLIRSNGTVQARTRINIVPQVGGQIIYIHPQFRAGGYLQAHQVLFKIEPIDYQLAVTNVTSKVISAERNYQLEIAESAAAIEEWQALQGKIPAPILVRREPQIAAAKTNLQAARARLQQAKINLNRTHISTPFASRVVQANIDIGEVINANQSVGIVYSTEQLEIPVPIEIDQLAWLDLSNIVTNQHKIDSTEPPAGSAHILITLARQAYRLPGKIIRVESELDNLSRLARVIISLKASDIPKDLREEIIPGLFVDVEIKARELQNITVLPRSVLRENTMLWVSKNQQLRFIKPRLIYQSDTEIWLRDIPANTIIISSVLDVVTEGMQVRIQPPQ